MRGSTANGEMDNREFNGAFVGLMVHTGAVGFAFDVEAIFASSFRLKRFSPKNVARSQCN